MNVKSLLAKPFAGFIYNKLKKGMETAVQDQDNILKELVKTAKNTEFGKEHGFENIQNYEDFKRQVPIRDYEQIKPYIEKVKEGKHNVLWKGKPIYLTTGKPSWIKL
jgi:hypothetical protein